MSLPTKVPESRTEARAVGEALATGYSPRSFEGLVERYPEEFREYIRGGYHSER